MRRQRDNERRRGGSAEVWRSLDGAAFTAPLFKATVQPKFVCTLLNIRMRNLVGVAMRSRFGALDHDIRRVRFAPSTDIVSHAAKRDSVVVTRFSARSIHDGPSEE